MRSAKPPRLTLAILLALGLLLVLATAPAQAQTSAGVDYDADNDGLIEISSLTQLDAIRYDLDGDGTASDGAYAQAFPRAITGMGCPNSQCAGYELITDLDFDTNSNGMADTGDAYWNDGAGWLPIGNFGNFFVTTFDGGNYTIANLYIDRGDTNLVGMFKIADSTAVIRRAGLISVKVSGNVNVGSLVGTNRGTVTDSYATGDMAGGKANLGGLVGYNGGTVADSYAAVNVSGCGHVTANDGRIECPSGGLVGYNKGTITGSYAVGNVSGGEDVGGLVGWNDNGGVIMTSYATGSVLGTGGGYAGGLVGNNYNSAIIASYATGRVSGNSSTNIGGLAAYNHNGTIMASYAIGRVPHVNSGGLVGLSYYGPVGSYGPVGDIIASYWDTQTSGQYHSRYGGKGKSYEGEGKTTAELQSPTGYTGIYANWNIDLDNADEDDNLATGGDDPWDFGTSSQYPTLKGVGPGNPTPPGVRLTAPTNVVATVSGSSVTVTWTDGQGAAGHLVSLYQSDLTGEPRQATAAGSSHTFRDVPPGDYIAVVIAFDADANQELATSSVVTVVAATGKLIAPTNVVATVSGSSVTVTWTDGQGAVSHLVFLFRSDFSGDPTIAPGAGGSYTFPNIAPGGYIAVVVAVDASGDYRFGISGPATVAAANTSAATDRAALVALYNATDGPNWTNNDGWLSDAPIGEWHGVETNDDGRVTTLELSNNGLTGILPAELGNLSKLVWLDFDYNRLGGSIPEELGSLNDLLVLRLGSNELTGAIPEDLGNLSYLLILGLGNNQLTGSIPSQLGDLSLLVRLSMWNNQLTGPIPPELGNLSGLQRLNLGRNRLTGEILASLGNLANLETLNLSRNQLSGSIPSTVGDLSDLTVLNLDNNELNGPIPSELTNLNSLAVLRLGGNQLNGEIPSGLGSLADLSILGLGNNQLSGSIPSQLGQATNLVHVSLYGNQLTGAIPSQLGSLADLSRLSLGSNRLSGQIPPQLSNLTQLQHLYLQENQLTGQIPSQLGDLSNLDNLDLSGNRLSGEIPAALGDLSSLKLLRLSNNELTGTIPPALGNLSNLTRLYLYKNQLTGGLPKELGRLAGLEVLDLSHNRLSGEIPKEIFTTAVAAHPRYRNDQGMPPELVLPTNVSYLEPGLRLSESAEAGIFSSLVVLNLSHNRFSGPIPSALHQHSTRQRIHINNNKFSADDDFFKNKKEMESGKHVDCTPELEKQGIKNDIEALAKLYEFTDGRGAFSLFTPRKWKKWWGWEQHFQAHDKEELIVPLDKWHGVELNDDGRVLWLHLNDNNLQGDELNDWNKHITTMNERTEVRGCAYPLYWLNILDFSDNKLKDADIGAILSNLRLQDGVALQVNLAGRDNWWNPSFFRDSIKNEKVYYEHITQVYVPDIADLREKMIEQEEITVSENDIAKLGLKILSKAGSKSVGKLIGKNLKGVGFVGSITQHDAVFAVFIGLLKGEERPELVNIFLDTLGINSKQVRDRLTHGCFEGEVWNENEQRCVHEKYDSDRCMIARDRNEDVAICY